MRAVLTWLKYHIWFWLVFPIAWIVGEAAFMVFDDRGVAIVFMSAAVLIWWLIAMGIEWYLRERDE